MAENWLAGVDGCPGGWLAAFVQPQGGAPRLRVLPRFCDVLAAAEAPKIVAVDMPMEATPPAGCDLDDLVDALACALIARRLADGTAQPFPNPPPRDDYGLVMAIWA